MRDDEIDFAAYAAPEPPADLADRVLARIAAEPRPRSRHGLALAGAVAAVAAGLALWLAHRAPAPAAHEVVATELSPVAIGPHRALAEPGAELTWRPTAHGYAVDQRAGRVSYDVAGPTEFTVSTPLATISVRGTQFTVEVMPMQHKGSVSAVVLVAVTAGIVVVASSRGEITLAAGEHAVVRPDTAPVAIRVAARQRAGVSQPAVAARRQELLGSLARARASREAAAPATRSAGARKPPALADRPGDLDKEYIRGAVKDAVPLIKECYEMALEEQPALAGDLKLHFTITGEPAVGGLVADVALESDDGFTDNATFSECLTETVLALELPAPTGGGEVKVIYPMSFRPSGGDE